MVTWHSEFSETAWHYCDWCNDSFRECVQVFTIATCETTVLIPGTATEITCLSGSLKSLLQSGGQGRPHRAQSLRRFRYAPFLLLNL
jgi:hypothetical protein